MTKQEVTDVKDSVVTLQVAVAGTWYYQFDNQQKQVLARQLINKSREAAQASSIITKGSPKPALILLVVAIHCQMILNKSVSR